jgi:hypothetical protein
VTTAIEREEEAEIINFCSPHARQPALLTETTQLPYIMWQQRDTKKSLTAILMLFVRAIPSALLAWLSSLTPEWQQHRAQTHTIRACPTIPSLPHDSFILPIIPVTGSHWLVDTALLKIEAFDTAFEILPQRLFQAQKWENPIKPDSQS